MDGKGSKGEWKCGKKGRKEGCMEEGDRNEMPHVCICVLTDSKHVTGCRYSILTSIYSSLTLTTQAYFNRNLKLISSQN